MRSILRWSAMPLLAAAVIGVASCQSTGGTPAPKEPAKQPPASETVVVPANRTMADLRKSLHDPELLTRLNAAEELGHRASKSPEAVNLLVEALADKEPLVRRFAAGGLAEAKPPTAAVIRALTHVLTDAENEPRESASRSLVGLSSGAPPETVQELGTMLASAAADTQESVRANAVAAIGALGPRGVRAVPALKSAIERALSDPVEGVRGSAATALGEWGADVPGTVALLTKALADKVHDVRKVAVLSVEKIGPKAAPATAAVARLLHGKEIYLRVFAANALAAIGPGARAALPELKALAAHGWKEIENSPEMEAKDLPDAVAKAIQSIGKKAPAKGAKAS